MIDTSRSMIYHIGNLNAQSQRINYQMATGKAIDKGSDDAMIHSQVINLEDKLRITEGLKLQIQKSQALNNSADSTMGEIKTSLDSIKIDLMKALNDGMDRSDKLALSSNLQGIRGNLLDRVNTKIDGEYIFSGSITTNQTIIKDENFKTNGKVEFGGDGFLRKIAVQPGSYRERGITAYDVSFYTASKALAGESFTFSDGERIIDDNGNEWKFNANRDQLQKYDYNGKLISPAEQIAVTIPKATEFMVDLGLEDNKSFKIDLGVGVNTDASGEYQITINDKTYGFSAANSSASDIYADLKKKLEDDGFTIGALTNDDEFVINSLEPMDISVADTDGTYDMSSSITTRSGTYTVTLDGVDYSTTVDTKTTAQIHADLKTAIEAGGYTVEAMKNSDQFVIKSGTEVVMSVSDTDANYNIWGSNEQEATINGTAIQGTYNLTVPTTPEGRVFEAKHNYFDDLNVIINALDGHATKLDGTKGSVVNDDVVDDIIRDGLGKTTTQFDATNIGHGQLGGRNNIFEVAYEKLSTQSTHYNILLQEVGGADLTKLAMESKSLEITYQALYSTISKMNQLSLVNFLK
jgi:flagellin-like hook-associated protein FlgL